MKKQGTHILVPMSGTGERFKKAGFAVPKPLIDIDSAPMIKHVVSMFPQLPSEQIRFTFICNQDHLEQTDMRSILHSIAPAAEILSVPSHKRGPVGAVLQCLDCIRDDEETIVNYCDFYSYWNFADFLSNCRSQNVAGAIVAYRGFHPHMLGPDNYAFIKAKQQWLEAIQEKKPFTDNKMNEYASNGTYYFQRGEFVKTYFQQLVDREIAINGEYYVSMVFNLMVEDGLPVSIYEIQHMLQWGTPRDLSEYKRWSEYFRKISDLPHYEKEEAIDICLLPMAGRGARFSAEGYKIQKPLIPVSGKPMVVQACSSLPQAKRQIFVLLKEQIETSNIKKTLEDNFSNISIVTLDEVTDGQATTCEFGLTRALPPVQQDASLLIGACDNGMLYDQNKMNALIEDQSIDVAAFSFRNHPSAQQNPQMYGWLKVDDGQSQFPVITGVSVKVPISQTPQNDHAIVGAFYFRKVKQFLDLTALLKKRDIKVNDEYYVDSLIGLAVERGLRCVAFEVIEYVCFGTPNDLRTFQYWQSFFHKCVWHPYSIEKDQFARANDDQLLQEVDERYHRRLTKRLS
jgi:NDP-sugar pyrophosphorylase family protein